MVDILNEYLIPDISNIVIKFIDSNILEFTDEFVNNCVLEGNYLYHTENLTLLHYRIYNKRYKIICSMLKNSTYLNINHF